MAQAIGLNCLGSPTPTRNPWLPPYDCPDGLRGEIRFPSCWDGVNLDSPTHNTHVAYPIDNESGPCPAGYPVRIVTLFYEVSRYRFFGVLIFTYSLQSRDTDDVVRLAFR